MSAAKDGLYLDGREAAAVQYGQSVQYIPMVEGIIKVLHNSGLIKLFLLKLYTKMICLTMS